MKPAADIATAGAPYFHVQYAAPCNLRCFYCYEKPHPTAAAAGLPARIEGELRRARAAGYRVAAFGAAELLLLPFRDDAIRAAKSLGFERVLLLSNLLALDERKLDALARAGLDGITGTVFAVDDESAVAVAGGRNVLTRQRRAARLVAAHGGVAFSLHVILTRSVAADLSGNVLRLRDELAPDSPRMIVSAIEPIREATRRHPLYVHGLELDWAGAIARADREGLGLVVQNVPACALGAAAHRSFFLLRRVARLLEGWPREPEAARFVDRAESLGRRIPATGPCVGCSALVVCHRWFEHPIRRRLRGVDPAVVVGRVLAEEGLRRAPAPIVSALRTLARGRRPAGALDLRRGR